MTEMLQKTENVANNVANKNSQDLTEQMHKGELPDGWYYVIKTGDVEMLEYSCNYFLAGDVPLIDNEVTEVLAPVPSYTKLQSMNEAVNECMAANIKLVEQNKELKEILERHKKATAKAQIRSCDLEIINAQLKELLKECELWFTGTIGNMNDKNVGEHNRNLPIGNFEHMFKVFSQKINNALED